MLNKRYESFLYEVKMFVENLKNFKIIYMQGEKSKKGCSL